MIEMVTKEKKHTISNLAVGTMVLNLPTLFFVCARKTRKASDGRGLCVPIFFDGSLGFGGENRGILE